MDNDELKIKIPVLVDDDAAAKARFQKSIETMTKGMTGAAAPKIEITVSKINGKSAIAAFKKEIEAVIGSIGNASPKTTSTSKTAPSYWQGRFKESVSGLTAKNLDLKPLNDYYQKIESAQAASSKKQENEALRAQERMQKIKDTALMEKNNGTATAVVTNVKTDIEKYSAMGRDVSDAKIAFEGLVAAQRNVDTALNATEVNVEEVSAAYKEYKSALVQANNLLGQVKHQSAVTTSVEKNKAALHNLILEMQAYEKANDRLHNNAKYSTQFDSLKSRSQTAFDAGDFAKVQQLNEEMRTLRGNISAAGLEGQKFGSKLGQQFEKLGVYLSASAIIMKLGQSVKEMIKNVTALDGAMTELRKVTDETDSTYTKFLDNAVVRAKNLGATLVDTVSATADFARLGYSLKDSEQIADSALVYKNVGDGIRDIGDASGSIISTMKANMICLYVQKCA